MEYFTTEFLSASDFYGGRVALYVDILRGEHVGDVLKSAQLKTLADCGIEVGVELFP